MSGADEVRCSGEPRRAVDCKGEVKGRLVFCEFRYEEGGGLMPAYGGTGGCWSDRGGP